MRVEIYNPDKKQEPEPLRLELNQDGDVVDVRAIDKDGTWLGNLLSFTSNGRIYLYSAVAKNLGLDLTKTGTIKVVRGT